MVSGVVRSRPSSRVSPHDVVTTCRSAIGSGADGTSGRGAPTGAQVIRGDVDAAAARGAGSLARLTVRPTAAPQPTRTTGPRTHPSAEQPPVDAASGGSGEAPAARHVTP